MNKRFLSKYFKVIFIFTIGTYLGLAMAYVTLPKPYSYRNYQPFNHGILTPLMQPIMNIFGYGKVTHWYDWENYPEITESDGLVLDKTKIQTQRDFKQTFSLTNMLVSLGSISQGAVIDPRNYLGDWSLVFCTNQNRCYINALKYSGKVKIIADGEGKLFGISS